MFMSCSHSLKVANHVPTDFPEMWEQYVRIYVPLMKNFYDKWFERRTQLPVQFYRFEDIKKDQRGFARDIFKFTLGLESLEGTVVEKRINDLITDNNEKSGVYKPRSGKVNSNMEWFSKEQIEYVNKELRPYNFYFGFV